MRTRKYGGDREVILDLDKYFKDSNGKAYTQEQINEAARKISNTTSSFERYIVNSIGTYNGKEAMKSINTGLLSGVRRGAKYCDKDFTDPECLQRGARMKKAFQMFADMPPQAYFQFGVTSVLNQGVNALGDTGKSLFGVKRGGTRKNRSNNRR